jgi:septum formation inhibitor-activating ATPase MinD
VLETLSTPRLAVMPESREALRSSHVEAPVTIGSLSSAPAQAYLDAARRLNGEGAGVIAATNKPEKRNPVVSTNEVVLVGFQGPFSSPGEVGS